MSLLLAADTPVLDDGYWLPSVRPWKLATLVLLVGVAASAAPPALEAEGYLPPVRQSSVARSLPHWLFAPDDVVPVAQESDWLPWVPQAVAPFRWAAPVDEDFVAPVTAALDDAGYLPTVQQPSYRLTLLQGTAAVSTPLGTPSTDDLAPYVLYVTPQPRLPLWLGATDEAVPQPSMVEDEPYLPLVRAPSYQLRLLASSSAVATPPSLVGNPTDEWHYQQFLPPPAPLVLFGPWSYGVAEDIAQLLVSEDQWQPRVVWPEYRRVLLSGSMAPSAVFAVGIPIDEHQAVVPLVAPASVTLFGPWSYGVAEDTIPLLQGDEGLWLPPLVTPATWARLVLVQPDELPFLYVTEDQWLPPLVQPATTARLVLTLPDERPSLVTLGVTEDYWLASFLPIRHIVRGPVPMLPPWAYEQREQGFGLIVPPSEEGRAVVVPRYLWARGVAPQRGGFGRG